MKELAGGEQFTRHFPANAFCSFARSCFVTCITRSSPAASFTHSAKNFAGIIRLAVHGKGRRIICEATFFATAAVPASAAG
jgi:hypothetical protein